jgi:hypothetical protein
MTLAESLGNVRSGISLGQTIGRDALLTDALRDKDILDNYLKVTLPGFKLKQEKAVRKKAESDAKFRLGKDVLTSIVSLFNPVAGAATNAALSAAKNLTTPSLSIPNAPRAPQTTFFSNRGQAADIESARLDEFLNKAEDLDRAQAFSNMLFDPMKVYNVGQLEGAQNLGQSIRDFFNPGGGFNVDNIYDSPSPLLNMEFV